MTEWYILPGMGASSEMYDAVKRELSFNAHFLNWPKYRNEVSYGEVADRIIAENQINEDDIISGSSLGGMIALEVATILNVKAVVLMGSALNRNEINKLLSIISPLASITPFSFIQALSGRNEQIVSQMFAASDTEFIRSMCKYIPSWPGYGGPNDKVFRIHGQKDHIINCPRFNCEVIKDAGHLLAITHANECAEFLERTNSSLTLTQSL
jgi:pimeloyl-ACP methyl ester carboxylesterase